MFIGMQLLHTKDALPSITGDNGINKKKNWLITKFQMLHLQIPQKCIFEICKGKVLKIQQFNERL